MSSDDAWSPNAILRMLPRRVTPALNETVDCYLRRLSEENFFYHTELVDYVRNGIRDAPVSAERLAAITGLPAKSLRCAMLELCTPAELAAAPTAGRPRPGGRSSTACRHCTRRRYIQVWALHEDELLCLRHRCLRDYNSRDLSAFPDILQANRRHRLLIRRYGREPVRQAFDDAANIVRAWDEQNEIHAPYERLATIVSGKYWRVQSDSRLSKTARYPEAVALTRLLVAPQWRSLALFGHRLLPAGKDLLHFDFNSIDPESQVLGRRYLMSTRNPALRHFLKELRRTVISRYAWTAAPHPGKYDPFAEWVIDQLDRQYGLWEPVVGEPRERVAEMFT